MTSGGRSRDPRYKDDEIVCISFRGPTYLRDWLREEADRNLVAPGSMSEVLREIVIAEKARREQRAKTGEAE